MKRIIKYYKNERKIRRVSARLDTIHYTTLRRGVSNNGVEHYSPKNKIPHTSVRDVVLVRTAGNYVRASMISWATFCGTSA